MKLYYLGFGDEWIMCLGGRLAPDGFEREDVSCEKAKKISLKIQIYYLCRPFRGIPVRNRLDR
jgi:hypothetical protein